MFSRFIGIDYSGAETPDASLNGLQVFQGEHDGFLRDVTPPAGPKKYWTRKAIAEWLVAELSTGRPTIVGIDHGFSFPLAYFKKYKLPHDWLAFLDDFHQHWPTDDDHTYVDFIRDDAINGKPQRTGSNKWRRLTEIATGSAKSVFHFDVPGSVAKSTHAGLPWLRHIRAHASPPVHFWPFDGWMIPAGRSAIVEAYPRLWRPPFRPANNMTDHELDAYAIAATLREADADGRLERWLNPPMSRELRTAASIEGWILGVDPGRAEAVLAGEPPRGRGKRAPAVGPGARPPAGAFDIRAFLDALAFAARKHKGQRRKDADASPYVNHVIDVARILATEGGVTDQTLLTAAVLHDTVEDTETTLDEIALYSGATVADLVREMTDDKSLPKAERKRLQVVHAPHCSPGAKQMKIADKIANIREIIHTPPAGWPPERKREYLEWAEQVVAGCRGVNAALERVFDDVVAEGKRALARP